MRYGRRQAVREALLVALVTTWLTSAVQAAPQLFTQSPAQSLQDMKALLLRGGALAALDVDVQLASRLQHRATNQAVEERNRAAEDREQATRRTQIQAGCLVAPSRHLPQPTPPECGLGGVAGTDPSAKGLSNLYILGPVRLCRRRPASRSRTSLCCCAALLNSSLTESLCGAGLPN